jgi:RimJ/RimL family protein N-acetyltransferase
MNDPAITQYLESRFYPNSLETLKEYVISKNGDKENVFFAILLKEGNRHIGNVKVGPIDTIHRFADVGIIIGEKECWGKGYGTEAIRLIADYAFNVINLNKLNAGCYDLNKGSIKAFKKAGFSEEGRRRKQYFCNGKYVDDIAMGLLRFDYQEKVHE